jgi:hypothetical protein
MEAEPIPIDICGLLGFVLLVAYGAIDWIAKQRRKKK